MKNYNDILKAYWGYDDFRGIQREIIESIGAGHDTLGLMPTGGGKSITFQVPALAADGVCIVITPLIALMKDQVYNLRRRSIAASAIYSGMDHDEILQTLENAIFGAVKLLYVSPERLGAELFQKKLSRMKVSFICVDEAHCISQWGYDFRPSYLAIADIRRLLPGVPVLALTATATPAVIDDIQERLGFSEKRVFRMSFERKNLTYVVRHAEDKTEQLIHILNHVQGTAIVYSRSRMRTKETADLLCKAGINATFYHAGLDNAEKDKRQKAWQSDQVRVIVATNAFGMGIDKPDVRLVVHTDCPDSIEAYFQEAGRGGRDGQRAYAVLLYNDNDRAKLHKRIADQFPDKEYVIDVYEHLAYFYEIGIGSGYNRTFEFPIEKFCHTYKYFPIQVESALKILTRAGYVEYREEDDNQSRVMFTLERDALYRLKGETQEEDTVITGLMRNYPGLFNEYKYIEEAYLAQVTGLDKHVVYETLKTLDRKRILSFVPQKKIAHVRYLQRREDASQVMITAAAYDDLKTRFVERIDKMLDYAASEHQCRSQLLLRYFGETDSKPCGRCDVCLAEKNELATRSDIAAARRCILDLLADHAAHHVSELHAIAMTYEPIEAALRQLIAEEEVVNDDGYLSIS